MNVTESFHMMSTKDPRNQPQTLTHQVSNQITRDRRFGKGTRQYSCTPGRSSSQKVDFLTQSVNVNCVRPHAKWTNQLSSRPRGDN